METWWTPVLWQLALGPNCLKPDCPRPSLDVFKCSDEFSMCHFIADILWAARVGVVVAIVVAGDGVPRTLRVKHMFGFIINDAISSSSSSSSSLSSSKWWLYWSQRRRTCVCFLFDKHVMISSDRSSSGYDLPLLVRGIMNFHTA